MFRKLKVIVEANIASYVASYRASRDAAAHLTEGGMSTKDAFEIARRRGLDAGEAAARRVAARYGYTVV